MGLKIKGLQMVKRRPGVGKKNTLGTRKIAGGKVRRSDQEDLVSEGREKNGGGVLG